VGQCSKEGDAKEGGRGEEGQEEEEAVTTVSCGDMACRNVSQNAICFISPLGMGPMILRYIREFRGAARAGRSANEF
jgi:hypothetical protein